MAKISVFSESSPNFYNIHVPELSSQQLQIPAEFVKYFTGVVPCKSTITGWGKRSWHVELKKVDEHLYFQDGWQQFVHDNSLNFGDFLLFYYGGNAQLYVKIYGINGRQKKVISRPTREVGRDITHPQDNQTVERRKSKRLGQGANGKEIAQKKLRPIFSLTTQEGSRARKEAIKFVSEFFVSEFPFFEVVMSRSNIKRSDMTIPTSFHNIYMEKNRDGVILVASEQSWPVKVSTNDKTRRKFLSGWSTFCRENTLKVDDVCVFELIEKDDFVLEVSIFRCPD